MPNPIVTQNGKQYELVFDPENPFKAQLVPLLLKSNGEPEMPYGPGTIYIVYRDTEVMGWVAAQTASQALELSFGHPHNPMYRAIAWSLCKHETQRTALEEGRIEGRIWEGCPDCQSLIATLNAQICTLQGQLLAMQPSTMLETVYNADPAR